MIKKTTYIQTNREKAELTQSQAGSMIGIDRSSISFYEGGKTLPNIFTLIKLAKIYNLEIYQLIANN